MQPVHNGKILHPMETGHEYLEKRMGVQACKCARSAACLDDHTSVVLCLSFRYAINYIDELDWAHARTSKGCNVCGHVCVPNQSCGSWTVFLSKHFRLVPQICVAVGVMSENVVLNSAVCTSVRSQWRGTLKWVMFVMN